MQNKYKRVEKQFCHICRLWTGITKLSLKRHEQSMTHKVNQEKLLKNNGRRVAKFEHISNHHLMMKNEYMKIHEEAIKSFNKGDSTKYGHLQEISYVEEEPDISDPIINDPDWTCHFDENGKVYYYNRFTKEKTLEKPEEFDGYDPKESEEINSIFTVPKCTPLIKCQEKGLIGQWVTVDKKDEFFSKHAIKEEGSPLQNISEKKSETKHDLNFNKENSNSIEEKEEIEKSPLSDDSKSNESSSDKVQFSNPIEHENFEFLNEKQKYMKLKVAVENEKYNTKSESFNKIISQEKTPQIENAQNIIIKKVAGFKRKKPETDS